MRTIRFLFVDDDENRCREINRIIRQLNALENDVKILIDIAMTPDDAIRMLSVPVPPYDVETPRYDVCSLDHDMAAEHYQDLKAGQAGQGTGRDITLFLTGNPSLCPPICNIHSWNPAGAQAMAGDLRDMIGGPNWIGMERFGKHQWFVNLMESK